MLKPIVVLMAALCWSEATAQFTVSGRIADARDGSPLPGATLQDSLNAHFAVADEQGNFAINDVPTGAYAFRVRHVGFAEKTVTLAVDSDKTLNINLDEAPRWAEGVTVYATRVAAHSPVAFIELDKDEIDARNTGRDMPFVLAGTPSLVPVSDTGNGVGYTGLRLRGSDPTRINITINGIPFNDSESHGVFWVNMPDIASSAKSIQVQRGVGTSVHGAGAFGGSVNIDTDPNGTERYAELTHSYGSFHTHRHTVQAGSGMLAKRLAFEGRLSLIRSDGFVDRASCDLRSFYASARYQRDATTIRFIAFGGREITYQSWYGTPASRLQNNEPEMRKTALAEGWNSIQTDHLLNASNPRTFNVYTYPDQVDNYTQNHYQLHGSHRFSPAWAVSVALHATRGKGYFEEFKYAEPFERYGASKPVFGDTTIAATDLVRRRWLDNVFYGITYSGVYHKKRYHATVGGAWNRYEGSHFGRVIWASVAQTLPKGFRYYLSKSDKYDFNIFWKSEYRIAKNIHAFLDLQYRTISYRTAGTDPTAQGLRDIDVEARYDFFNPKGGVTYRLLNDHEFYASYGIAHREPVRDDFINASEDRFPQPEVLHDLEAGWRMKKKKYNVDVNAYWMRYPLQRVLTGEVNDVGESIRTGVVGSYRVGVEIAASARLTPRLTWQANATWSHNAINAFTETLYDYGEAFDRQEKVENNLGRTDISFSPSVIAGSRIAYTPLKGLACTLSTRYVGAQFLDNTSNPDRMLDSYLVNDLRVAYTAAFRFVKEATLSVTINNLFDAQYESNGYTYGYLAGREVVRQNYYYPQAGIHYAVLLSLRF